MYAIIETGGKQFKVSEGDVVFIEKLDVNENDAIKEDYDDSFGREINNRAYEQQQKGKLENYLLSAPIHYSKEELEEILRKYGLL